jgi:hypothetical protein
MKRTPLFLTALGLLAVTACGPGELVVTAEIDVPDPATGEPAPRQLSGLEVVLLPYDRDMIFDSLTAAASSPEPEVPAALIEAQNEIAEAGSEWRELETQWNTLRDTLQKINTTLQEYTRGEAQYRLLFDEFQDMEAQYNTVESRKDAAFARFDSLTRANIEQAQEYQLRYDDWADMAYEDADGVMLALESESGLRTVVDTTDATGTARIEAKPGQYWAHARYEEPYSELYWNVPVEVARGEPVTLSLSRANAEVRPIF